MAPPARHRTRALDVPAAKGTRPQGARIHTRVRMVDEDPHIRALKAIQTQQLSDPFSDHYGVTGAAAHLSIMEPPFNFASLMRLPRENNMLRQCIDAMVTNVEGHGWRLEYVGPEGQEESAAAKNESLTLQNLLDFPNDDHGLQELRERIRRDLETMGNAFYEIGRDREGRVVLVAHVPAHTVRLTVKDEDEVDVTVTLPREGTARDQKIKKRFRRYVQLAGTRRVYFKEFGDPRLIDPTNGRPNEELGLEQSATEMIHLRLYAPGTPYGLPRWVNQMPSILGSRQAELTNLDFFKENAIPAMALLVSGGMVTQSTMDEIEEHFMAARGRESFNRIMVIEAHGDEDSATNDGAIPAPRMDLKPLQNDRLKDSLFQIYDKNNMAKIRSSFRLPPMFVGLAEDYTHATAKSSFAVAESQVFGPERARGDDLWNLKVLGSYKPQFWSFRSLPPRISDPTDVINAIEAFDNIGAMTPNVAIGLANDFFDLNMPKVEAVWGNFPFAVVRDLVSNQVVPEGLEDLVGSMPMPGNMGVPETEDEVVANMFKIVVRNVEELRKVLSTKRTAPPPRHRARAVQDA